MKELITINGNQMEPRDYHGQRVVTLRDIDTVHGRPEGTARKRFNDHKDRLMEGEDYFVRNSDEAKAEFDAVAPNGLTLITESGYLMLVKSFTDDLAWSVQRDLVNNYFRTKQAPASMEDILIYQLQEMKAVKSQMTALDAKVNGIRDIVALNPISWRTETKDLLAKIAYSLGGIEHVKDLHHEVYELVDARAGAKLETRLTNKRRRMAEEGASKSARDRLNKIDVIADDKKLIEIYIAIIKEMAVRNGVMLEDGVA